MWKNAQDKQSSLHAAVDSDDSDDSRFGEISFHTLDRLTRPSSSTPVLSRRTLEDDRIKKNGHLSSWKSSMGIS